MRTVIRERLGAVGAGIIMLTLNATFVLLVNHAAHAQPQCDCSCAAYERMQETMAQAKEAMQRGDHAALAAIAQASACSGQCAARWSACGNQANEGSRMGSAARDPSTAGDKLVPKQALTPAYLEGTWCSVYGGQETTQWVFDADGGYRIGVPADSGYAMQGSVRPLSRFLERFDNLLEKRADAFTTEHLAGRVSRNNEFTRGPCG